MNKIVCALVVIGAINWGLVGIGMLAGGANWNLVNMLLGNWMVVEAVVYILVGIAGVMKMIGCKCKNCKDGKCMPSAAPAAPSAPQNNNQGQM